ncbi:acyltransferase [Bosea caraganae]|uniref:Acyltransferase n=1 Tax=Bosea caraganae TaxID=2763117 RepID=A0A370L4R9_9HYPH|nr:acyltransferase family protein [Bosea caraganae]RDJ24092.1 acyltransferase [Bosea caraganae]RDJ30134.1 acyltransferase [Bosea caraganae]
MYRPDIDGLRALAILPVLLFHLNFPFVEGGFVGVDIFFVISGYLITRILRDDLDSGSYSIARFYERRARRILPALFVVLAASCVAGFAVMMPHDLVGLGQSALATLLFSSNILFLNQVGYFADPADIKPLLHTWSLAVEEQFYILFPLLLALLHRFGRRAAIAACLAIALVSFGAGIWLVQKDQAAAFYLAPTRVWELLIGSLLALGLFPLPGSDRLRQGLGCLGLGLIGFSILTYSESTLFPGIAALAPSIGAGLIIYSGQNGVTWVSRLLSLRPLVFIGLISYSLYLWHWPIQAFYRYEVTDHFSRLEKVGLLALCFACAIPSWRYVEQPFRTATGWGQGRRAFTAAAVAASLLFVAGGALVVGHGAAWRYPAKAEAVLAGMGGYDVTSGYREGSCFLTSKSDDLELFRKELCLGRDAARKDYLLVGDSHAAALWSGLSTTFTDIHFQQATASGCRPLMDGQGAERCLGLMRYIFEQHLPRAGSDAVVLAARWTHADVAGLLSTVERLKQFGRPVYVIGPIVEYQQKLPQLLTKSILSDDAGMVARNRSRAQKALDEELAQALRNSGATYISAFKTLCPSDQCVTLTTSGVPVQWDYGHLTREGSQFVAETWRRNHLVQ